MAAPLDQDALSEYFAALGRKGAKMRNQRLTPERRKEIATKASAAAAKVRTRKAKKNRPKASEG
jgi:hypothetical protein